MVLLSFRPLIYKNQDTVDSFCMCPLLSRTAFLLESLKDLDEQLRTRRSRLFVVRGKPEEELPKLFREWGVTKLAFEADFEPRSLQRDREVN